MAENSNIEWTDHTVNLWWGCAKVHAGCKNCYAENLSDVRYQNDLWGENKPRKLIKSAFKDLNKYQKKAEQDKTKVKVFIGSMMDIFEVSKPLLNPTDRYKSTGDLRRELFLRIRNGQYDNIIFLFLTKRPSNICWMTPGEWWHGRENIWFGTSVSDQNTVTYSEILRLSLPNNNLFLSIEPQIGNIDAIDLDGISWVIQGGESGPRKRPFDLQWARTMRDICKDDGTPYFFKQIDKVQTIPKDLQIREFPNLIDFK